VSKKQPNKDLENELQNLENSIESTENILKK
jgi:hypothetical protein